MFRAMSCAGFAFLASGLTAVPVADRAATIEVQITEGTNMAAALSPDGGSVALDLLGRIWVLPADGGTATVLTDPFGDARQPHWSPDGQRIAFQAYWAGDYDIWVVHPDGSGLEQITTGPFDDREPHWSPDGARVVFSSDRAGTYDIWDVSVATGEVRRLTQGEDNEYGPAYAPDASGIAYASDGATSGIWIRPLGAGAPRRIVDLGDAEGFAPSWSPAGDRIAYNRLTYGESGLYIVATDGSASGLGVQVSEGDEDVFPFRASWRPDGNLLYTADGNVRARPTSGGRATDVDFQATVTLERPAYRRALRSFDPEEARPVRGIVSPAISPDGSTVAFTALGDLWMMVIGEAPARVTDDPWVEVGATWSADGTRLAFASDREGDVDVWVREVASGAERRVTDGGGTNPAWSPDGREIAFNAGGGPNGGIRVVDVASGQTRTVRSGLNNPGRPTWSADGSGIVVSAHWRYSTRFREGVNRPLWMPVIRPVSEDSDAGPRGALHDAPVQTAERWLDFMPHGSVASRGTDGPTWSPNGRLMAYVADGLLWSVSVGGDGNANGPARRLNNEFSSDPTWAGDSNSILYLTTDRLRRVWLDDGRIEDVPVPLTWSREVPVGRLVVHAGALFDGIEDELQTDVDIVVDGHRIVRVTSHADNLHRERVVDASDGVVLPGLVDIHSHFGLTAGEQLGRQWLAFGVTTTRQPSSDPFEMVEARESEAAGRRISPRIFGSGPSVDGSRIYYGGSSALTSSGQAELQMNQAGDLGFDLLKTYVRLPDAVQRRLIEDSHASGIPVTSHELYPAVAYGADGVEHVRGTSRRGYSTKVTEVYRSYQDVVELLARSGMVLTPTVGIYGSFAFVAETDPSILDDPRVREFLPGVAGRARRGGDLNVRRRMLSDMASLGRRVLEAGGTVAVGTDSPQDKGLTLLAEMQALVELGGMRPVDVMRGATSVAAEALGYGAELGAVRPGMLADLIVVADNPLDDIRAVRGVRTVIKDGRVYQMSDLLQRPGA